MVILNINDSKQFCVPPNHIHFTYIKVDDTYVITTKILLCHEFDQNLCIFLHHHLWIRLLHFVINLCSYLLCFHNCSNTQGSKDTNSLSWTILNIYILLLKLGCEQQDDYCVLVCTNINKLQTPKIFKCIVFQLWG